jgi:hypothetical protein
MDKPAATAGASGAAKPSGMVGPADLTVTVRSGSDSATIQLSGVANGAPSRAALHSLLRAVLEELPAGS